MGETECVFYSSVPVIPYLENHIIIETGSPCCVRSHSIIVDEEREGATVSARSSTRHPEKETCHTLHPIYRVLFIRIDRRTEQKAIAETLGLQLGLENVDKIRSISKRSTTRKGTVYRRLAEF